MTDYRGHLRINWFLRQSITDLHYSMPRVSVSVSQIAYILYDNPARIMALFLVTALYNLHFSWMPFLLETVQTAQNSVHDSPCQLIVLVGSSSEQLQTVRLQPCLGTVKAPIRRCRGQYGTYSRIGDYYASCPSRRATWYSMSGSACTVSKGPHRLGRGRSNTRLRPATDIQLLTA